MVPQEVMVNQESLGSKVTVVSTQLPQGQREPKVLMGFQERQEYKDPEGTQDLKVFKTVFRVVTTYS